MSLPIHILIACTEEPDRTSLAKMVRAAGFRAVCCSSLAEAKALLAQADFRAVLCQDRLSDGDYRALLKQLARAEEKTPLVVVSDINEWGEFLGVMRAGAFDYIARPFDSDELERILWTAVEEARRDSAIAVPVM